MNKHKYLKYNLKDLHMLNTNDSDCADTEEKEEIRKICTELYQNIQKKEFLIIVAMLNKLPEARVNKDYKDIKPFIERCHFMKKTNLPLNDFDKIEFCKQLKYKYFKSGKSIYRRGSDNQKLYFILKGKVAITYPVKTELEK